VDVWGVSRWTGAYVDKPQAALLICLLSGCSCCVLPCETGAWWCCETLGHTLSGYSKHLWICSNKQPRCRPAHIQQCNNPNTAYLQGRLWPPIHPLLPSTHALNCSLSNLVLHYTTDATLPMDSQLAHLQTHNCTTQRTDRQIIVYMLHNTPSLKYWCCHTQQATAQAAASYGHVMTATHRLRKQSPAVRHTDCNMHDASSAAVAAHMHAAASGGRTWAGLAQGGTPAWCNVQKQAGKAMPEGVGGCEQSSNCHTKEGTAAAGHVCRTTHWMWVCPIENTGGTGQQQQQTSAAGCRCLLPLAVTACCR
jgi:hypothetical protein